MTSASSLVFTALCLAGWYIGQALLWWRPAKRWFGENVSVLNLVLAFLLSNTTLVMLSYLLDVFSGFSRPALWSLWMALGLGANLVCRRVDTDPGKRAAETMGRRLGIYLLPALLYMAFLHMQDPLRHLSLAGGDSYHFFRFFHRVICEQKPLDYYLSGLAVGLGTFPFALPPYDVTRLAPIVFSVLSLVPVAIAWQSIVGWRAALLMAYAWAGSFALYAPAAFYPLIIQWTTVPLCLALLARYLPCAIRDPQWKTIAAATLVLIFFTLSAAYLALFISVLIALGLFLRLFRFRLKWRHLLLALISPAVIFLFYGVFLPYGLPESNLDIERQAAMIATVGHQGAPYSFLSQFLTASFLRHWLGPQASQLVQTGMAYVLPKRFAFADSSPIETVAMLGVGFVGFLGLITWRQPRWATRRWLVFGLLWSLFSAITGSLEFSGFSGRSLFATLILALPLGIMLALKWGQVFLNARPAFRRLIARFAQGYRPIFYIGLVIILLSWVPAFFMPPSIGATVPVAADSQPRILPDSDAVMGYLFEAPKQVGTPRADVYVLVSTNGQPPAVMDAILRMHLPLYQSFFPHRALCLVSTNTLHAGDTVIFDIANPPPLLSTNYNLAPRLIYKGRKITIAELVNR